MRFALHLFALLVAVSATAATLIARQSLPACAVSCLANANTGSCTVDDDSCLCKDAAFINSTTVCIESACTGSDLANAEAYAQQLCAAVGVTLTVSSASATATTASSSSSSATPTTSSSSGAPLSNTISALAGAVAALAIAAVL